MDFRRWDARPKLAVWLSGERQRVSGLLAVWDRIAKISVKKIKKTTHDRLLSNAELPRSLLALDFSPLDFDTFWTLPRTLPRLLTGVPRA